MHVGTGAKRAGRRRRIRALLCCLGAATLLTCFGEHTYGQSQGDEALWSALASGGHVALIRHAIAPGVGDPDHFKLNDCSTQRTLSEQGRQQARVLGERFRQHGIHEARVYSSQWCRCLETAKLLNVGEVIPFPALNSFFNQYERETEQTDTVTALIREQVAESTLVMVTHQVNITALTGIYPRSGEIIVLRPVEQALDVVGRIAPSPQ